MELVPTLGADRRAVGDRDRGSTTNDERIIELSSWMLVLGTVRFLCVFADLLSGFLDAYQRGPVTSRVLGPPAEDNSSIVAHLYPLATCRGGCTAPHALAAATGRGGRYPFNAFAGRRY